MRWPCYLGIVGTLSIAFAFEPVSTTKKPVNTATKGKTAKSAPVASKAKGKRSSRRVARKSAGPSYQLHPDPERYAEIQHALADRGYFHGEATGDWKDDSVDALKHFQADQKLPDDGRISALTLSGLGLGPHHDGSKAATVPLPTAPASEPPVSGSTVGPASSPGEPSGQSSPPVSPNQPPRQ